MSSNLEREMSSFNRNLFENDSNPIFDYENDQEFHLFLPFSDLQGWVNTKDEIYQTYLAFQPQVERLRNIQCLSFLSYINNDVDIEDQSLYRFGHDRFNHTYMVAVTGATILTQNKVSKLDFKKYLAAAFLHDAATPGLGDATKFVDNKNLHEELFWQEILTEDNKEFLQNIPSNLDEIDSIIKNKGLLGEVLDIADRITYVCQDLGNMFSKPRKELSKNEFTNKLSKFIFLNPKIGDIYKDVQITQKGEVYFSNPQRLHQFLWLRALLHQKFYMHPVSQGRDLIVTSFIKPCYNSENNTLGQLTPKILRQMDDNQVIDYLAQKNNLSSYNFDNLLDKWFPQFYERFQDKESLQKRIKFLKNDSQIKIIGIKECKGFNPSTKYKVKDKEGKIVTYHEYNPQGAKVIEKIAQKTKGLFLFYEDVDRHDFD